jgi:hypothetical protein
MTSSDTLINAGALPALSSGQQQQQHCVSSQPRHEDSTELELDDEPLPSESLFNPQVRQ